MSIHGEVRDHEEEEKKLKEQDGRYQEMRETVKVKVETSRGRRDLQLKMTILPI
jgi:hypothetical protein